MIMQSTASKAHYMPADFIKKKRVISVGDSILVCGKDIAQWNQRVLGLGIYGDSSPSIATAKKLDVDFW